MNPLDEHPELNRALRTLRICVGAMAAGLAIFLGVIAFLHYGQGLDPAPDGSGLLTSVALAIAGALVLGNGMVRMMMMRRAQAAWTAGEMPAFRQHYAAAIIAGAALIEGAGLLLGTTFLLERDTMALTAAVLCLLILLTAVPSPGKLTALLEMTP